MLFPLHSLDTAPEPARPALRAIVENYGFLPNLAAVFAESPATLAALLALIQGVASDAMTLTRREREVAFLAASAKHNCEYCMAAHGMLAHRNGLDRGEVRKLQSGQALADARLQALREFVESVVERRGRVPEGPIDKFLAAGFSRAQVLEAVLGVALKTLTNYVNHIAKPPVNRQFAEYLPQVEPAG